MLMSEKIKKAKSKKAFTLIELVIVIAVLGVLAAIAVPVITTTINSGKLSTLESNSATIEMMLKEAINASKAEMRTLYNGQRLSNATVEDVLIQHNIDVSVMEVQEIGSESYAIYWESTLQGTSIHSGTGVEAFDIQTRVGTLDDGR